MSASFRSRRYDVVEGPGSFVLRVRRPNIVRWLRAAAVTLPLVVPFLHAQLGPGGMVVAIVQRLIAALDRRMTRARLERTFGVAPR